MSLPALAVTPERPPVANPVPAKKFWKRLEQKYKAPNQLSGK
jgi:hypothetical protein